MGQRDHRQAAQRTSEQVTATVSLTDAELDVLSALEDLLVPRGPTIAEMLARR